MKPEEYYRLWLAEDAGPGDYSSLSCIPAGQTGRAVLKAKERGLIAGIEAATGLYQTLCGNSISIQYFKSDGDEINPGDAVFQVSGSILEILKTERIVLNCMQRMSGIATMTRKFCEAVKGTQAVILDTRKTTPMFRYFEKWAVRIGGGQNHRMGLYEMIMLKDNHIDSAGGIANALSQARQFLKDNGLFLKIEIETRNLEEVEQVLAAGGADRIMLDNFTPDALAEAVHWIQKRTETEASGNITLQNVREYALTGVDFISTGSITHSYKSLDLSLKIF
jgi:nicotinate-nucleotide pyrophosphorylase (carboxylating)